MKEGTLGERALSGLAPLKEPLGGEKGASETGRNFFFDVCLVVQATEKV